MPIIDPFQNQAMSRPNSYRNARTIVPNDDEDLEVLPSHIWAEKLDGSAFTIRMQMGDEEITLTFPASKDDSPTIFAWGVSPTRIYATGTTADKITLFW